MNTGSARRGSCGLTGRSDSIFEKSVSSGCAAVRRRVTRDRPPRSPRFPPPRGRRTRRNPVYHDATTARLHVSQHRAYTARRNISHQRAHIVTRPRHASACLCSLVLFLVLFETPPPRAPRGSAADGEKGGRSHLIRTAGKRSRDSEAAESRSEPRLESESQDRRDERRECSESRIE